jgi:hypothetical protein
MHTLNGYYLEPFNWFAREGQVSPYKVMWATFDHGFGRLGNSLIRLPSVDPEGVRSK